MKKNGLKGSYMVVLGLVCGLSGCNLMNEPSYSDADYTSRNVMHRSAAPQAPVERKTMATTAEATGRKAYVAKDAQKASTPGPKTTAAPNYPLFNK